MTEHITTAEYKAMGKRKNKFGNRFAYRCGRCGGALRKGDKCCGDAIFFRSDKEAKRYDVLRQQQVHGFIRGLHVQPEYPIYIRGKLVSTPAMDFIYVTKGGREVVEDVKGKDNSESRLKRKMVEAAYDIEVEVIK